MQAKRKQNYSRATLTNTTGDSQDPLPTKPSPHAQSMPLVKRRPTQPSDCRNCPPCLGQPTRPTQDHRPLLSGVWWRRQIHVPRRSVPGSYSLLQLKISCKAKPHSPRLLIGKKWGRGGLAGGKKWPLLLRFFVIGVESRAAGVILTNPSPKISIIGCGIRSQGLQPQVPNREHHDAQQPSGPCWQGRGQGGMQIIYPPSTAGSLFTRGRRLLTSTTNSGHHQQQ